MKTIIGLYDNISNIDRLLEPLMRDGIDADHVEVVTSPGMQKKFKERSQFSNLAHDAKKGTLHTDLAHRGVPTADAYFFEQGVEQGNTLVILEVDDDRAPRILQQMKNGEARMGQSTSGTRSTDGRRTEEPAMTARRDAATDGRRMDDEEVAQRIPIIEEELHVGKKVRDTGGIHVERTVQNKPVHESIDLKEEHVEVNRHSANRPATNEDLMGAFEEGSFDLREEKEELIVEKEPRVVEEVEIRKTVEHKQQAVDETLRRVDVNIQELNRQAPTDMRYEALSPGYRKHFDANFGSRGERFEDFEPAYRFGHAHALRDDWRSHDFQTVSPHLKADYEKRSGKGSWERGRAAIEHAWNDVRSRF